MEIVQSQRGGRRATSSLHDEPEGATERRIAAEVALLLRISPRFSDDGKAEGTVMRPVSIVEVDEEPEAELGEQGGAAEHDLTDEFIRAFRD